MTLKKQQPQPTVKEVILQIKDIPTHPMPTGYDRKLEKIKKKLAKKTDRKEEETL